MLKYVNCRRIKESKLSPQDIVDNVAGVFSRLHVLVVGPGLSRDSVMLESAKSIIEKAKEKNMAIVIDAVSLQSSLCCGIYSSNSYFCRQDGLFLVQNHPETVKDYQKAVLTPNVVEFKRLCEAMVMYFVARCDKRTG
jgi:ATP-dependent NAD(P)H-hydrate dehydratase